MNYALITGASSGIGLEYARQLAAKGYNLVIVSNQDEANRSVASEIAEKFGVEALPLYADLSQVDSAQKVYDWCHGKGIEVDILINNAGMLLFSTLEHTDPARINVLLNLHCTTPTHLCRLFSADMKARGRGHILIMSSIAAWLPFPTISLYAASKTYLRSFAQSLWYEVRDYGVSVTVVFPSAVDTPLYNLGEKPRRWLLRLGVMMTAKTLARKGLRAMFRRRRRCIPGFLPKIEYAICAALPAHALIPIMKLPIVKRLLAKL